MPVLNLVSTLQHPRLPLGADVYQPLGHSLPSLRACPWPQCHSQSVCSCCNSWSFQYSQRCCCHHLGLWSIDLFLLILSPPPPAHVSHSLPWSETPPQTIISISRPLSLIASSKYQLVPGLQPSLTPMGPRIHCSHHLSAPPHSLEALTTPITPASVPAQWRKSFLYIQAPIPCSSLKLSSLGKNHNPG